MSLTLTAKLLSIPPPEAPSAWCSPPHHRGIRALSTHRFHPSCSGQAAGDRPAVTATGAASASSYPGPVQAVKLSAAYSRQNDGIERIGGMNSTGSRNEFGFDTGFRVYDWVETPRPTPLVELKTHSQWERLCKRPTRD